MKNIVLSLTILASVSLGSTIQLLNASKNSDVILRNNGRIIDKDFKQGENLVLTENSQYSRINISADREDYEYNLRIDEVSMPNKAVALVGLSSKVRKDLKVIDTKIRLESLERQNFDVKVLNASGKHESIDIYIDGILSVGNVSYSSFSDYLNISQESSTVSIHNSGSDNSIAKYKFPKDELQGQTGILFVTYNESNQGSELNLIMAMTSGKSFQFSQTDSPVIEENLTSQDSESPIIEVRETTQVQIVHNSPSPAVDVYVDGTLAVENFTYRSSTGLVDLPLNTVVGIAPTGGDIIAEFPFELEEGLSYVVVASGILNDTANPFTLLASTLDQEAENDQSFALNVLHGVTDAPAVDVYADGELVIENLAYSEFTGYLQVPVGDYTLDITAHGAQEAVASFSAPLAGLGGGSGVLYASGFLAGADTDPAFALVLTTPSSYVVELPAAETGLGTAEVQIVHNSPSPAVDIYVDGALAVENFTYRSSTGLVDLPLNTVVGIAPTGGDIIAEFPFTLEQSEDYVVVASGVLNDTTNPFTLLASTLEQEADDDESFALKVLHGVTDAPAVDIYANGGLLIENLAYGEFTDYLEVPAGDYTIDITAHGAQEAVASFYAPLTGLGGGSGVLYASGFLAGADTDPAFALVLTTPSSYVVELPVAETGLDIDDSYSTISNEFAILSNYPNPFNPVTSIRYNLEDNSNVKITIYDLLGNVINELFQGNQSAGFNNISWNATNSVGESVSTGVYIYKIQTDASFKIGRMMYLK